MTDEPWPYPPDPAHAGMVPLAGPLHVPSLSDDEHDGMLTDLRLWVAQLVTRFQISARVIPACWERHNGMVEALQALRDLERDCYSDKAPPSAAVDWFRGFREIEARLTELTAVITCTHHEHVDPKPHGPRFLPTPGATGAGPRGAPPEPSPL